MPFRRDAIAQDRELRAEVSFLRKPLEKPRSAAKARALLIARLYALPLPRVLALRSEDVAVERIRLTLWREADAIEIDKLLADKPWQWIACSPMWKSLSRPWVFPGRHGLQPLSEAAVAY